MKKIIFYLILLSALVLSACLLSGKPIRKELSVTQESVIRCQESTDSSEHAPTQPDSRLEAELNYYFERHNLQDDGYEMVVAFAGGRRYQATLDPHVSIWNVGSWNGRCRKGTALALDSLGRTIVGTCHNDSLTMGFRIDSIGTYIGDFYQEKPDGHGAYMTYGDDYYEGHWANGYRNGFGLEAATTDGEVHLRVGQWRNDRFMGERMRHTSERIYGIDISRYQHGKGRKKYPIYWDKLRIVDVGKRGSENVRGIVDYPVSFVYIKATEGTTVRNQYFVNDYAKARKQGIRVGAYHFWSMRMSGTEQAQYFIRHTLFRSGDLPPVLDVEPSDAQIRLMGGQEKMFAHIRKWLKLVEQFTGVKPILYVNQMFVNKYLSKQSDLKRDYCVWIARYSEYKPDVKLTYWQLSSDGRVAGIQGDVDINVFNGYQNQFEEYLEKETIR